MVERERNIWGGYISHGYSITYLVSRMPECYMRAEKSAGTPLDRDRTHETTSWVFYRYKKNHGIAAKDQFKSAHVIGYFFVSMIRRSARDRHIHTVKILLETSVLFYTPVTYRNNRLDKNYSSIETVSAILHQSCVYFMLRVL